MAAASPPMCWSAYTDPNANRPACASPAAAKPAGRRPGKPPANPDTGRSAGHFSQSGKLQRVEAFGNVEVRTTADTVRGDRGVYVADTGIARIVGHVRITHGQNQSNGPAADVNMKTGIAHLVSDPSERVNGLIMPNDAQKPATTGAAPSPAGGKKP